MKNLNTATIDLCFTYSAVTSFKNFDFMKINEVYDCKIYLFSELDYTGSNLTYIQDVIIGNRKVSEVSEVSNEKEDIYFIDKISTSESTDKKELLNYKYTRKDIIQVNNIVHPDFE